MIVSTVFFFITKYKNKSIVSLSPFIYFVFVDITSSDGTFTIFINIVVLVVPTVHTYIGGPVNVIFKFLLIKNEEY